MSKINTFEVQNLMNVRLIYLPEHDDQIEIYEERQGQNSFYLGSPYYLGKGDVVIITDTVSARKIKNCGKGDIKFIDESLYEGGQSEKQRILSREDLN